jgi:splicing factor 3A subunit 1
MQRVLAGEVEDEHTAESAAKTGDAPVAEQAPVDVGKEPPPLEFTLELPTMSAVDL